MTKFILVIILPENKNSSCANILIIFWHIIELTIMKSLIEKINSIYSVISIFIANLDQIQND